jgi:hypothetical protein
MSAQRDTDTNTVSIVIVGLIGTILLVVVVVALEAIFARELEAEQRRKVVNVPNQALRAYVAEQNERLNGYRVDPAGKVTIPIERAMELVVRESGEPAPTGRR